MWWLRSPQAVALKSSSALVRPSSFFRGAHACKRGHDGSLHHQLIGSRATSVFLPLKPGCLEGDSMMKSRLHLFFVLPVLALVTTTGCGDKSQLGGANQSQTGATNQSQTCTASFELFHQTKPFGSEQIAIFPVVDGKISTAADKKLGSGKTDANGRGTIEFKCSESSAQYVFLWEPDGKCCSMLRQEGKALTFSCGGAMKKCELGKIVFEVFEFGFGG